MHGCGESPWGHGPCAMCDQCRATSSLSHPIIGQTLKCLTGAGQSPLCHVARERWLNVLWIVLDTAVHTGICETHNWPVGAKYFLNISSDLWYPINIVYKKVTFWWTMQWTKYHRSSLPVLIHPLDKFTHQDFMTPLVHRHADCDRTHLWVNAE